MKQLMLRLEPLVWVLFGGGMTVAALLFPGWLLMVGLAVPLGIAPESALAYERALAIAASPVGRVLLVLMIALPLWGGAHHLRHVWIDFGGLRSDAWVGSLLYVLALAGSILAIVAVARL